MALFVGIIFDGVSWEGTRLTSGMSLNPGGMCPTIDDHSMSKYFLGCACIVYEVCALRWCPMLVF